ncbi:MAG: hypothetical protein ACFB9M_10115 [Myxococcota bacterium]
MRCAVIACAFGLLGACSPSTTQEIEGPVQDVDAGLDEAQREALAVRLSDIHQRPALVDLHERFGPGTTSALIRLAEDPLQNWLVRSRALEVLATSDDARARQVVLRFRDSERTPESVRRALNRLRPR